MINRKEEKFITTVWEFYKNQGRKGLPWRGTKDPYKILVSEIMLQQTQVDRVKPKYEAFLKQFPTIHDLSKAPLGLVLKAWQGLGYNRRAKLLHACAQKIVQEYKGKFPKNQELLVSLPGIGKYTSGAILAFAFNTPVVLIETNVRSVYLHHFFPNAHGVTDADLLPLIEKTLPKENPRAWYAALMDYGTHLKKLHGNPSKRSAHHVIHTTFKGSDRQIRGALIRTVLIGPQTRTSLLEILHSFEDIRVDAQIERLIQEGMLVKKRGKITLP